MSSKILIYAVKKIKKRKEEKVIIYKRRKAVFFSSDLKMIAGNFILTPFNF